MFALAPLAASTALAAGQALAGAVGSNLSGAISKSQASGQVKKTADEFETMFLSQTLDQLASSQGTEGPLGENGTGGGVYRSMLNQEYAQSIVKSGGVGIGDQVMREMLRMQEVGGGAGR
ncbi:rod-binding protein [uncultured Methylobacterium sp.]|jgi:flagellar protein FlgJ|uniref:rod-binding protein n=1 Tax=uncultured Methylobacterium sp. TaxID=157278 RepID=UPI002625CACE|nr:rod-binding protein [uncultured Methylobacterium sp.]